VIPLLLTAMLGATAADAEASYRAGLVARADGAVARRYFTEAAVGFEAMWDRGDRTPGAAMNMAQARLLAGDVGRAVRNYRLGLQKFPHDPGLKRGLEYARGLVNYPQAGDVADQARPRDPVSVLDRVPLTIPQLIFGLAVVTAVGWIALARGAIVRRGGLALFGAVVAAGGTAAGAGVWWEDDRARSRWAEPTAIVLTATELRTGNSDEYPKRLDGRLPAGAELRVLGERGGWRHVELAGGVAGWVRGDRTVGVE
jgi:hypothetical protein